MKCPNCGEESRESRINCLKCGQPLHSEEKSEGGVLKRFYSKHPLVKKCQACGYPNREGMKHCTRCGLLIYNPNKCPHCQGPIVPVDKFCPSCGAITRMDLLASHSHRPIAALLLALVPGLLSIWGIGHLFAGQLKKALLFLAAGLLLSPVTGLFMLSQYPNWSTIGLIAIIGTIIWIVLWLYQSYDAYIEAGGD